MTMLVREEGETKEEAKWEEGHLNEWEKIEGEKKCIHTYHLIIQQH